MKGWWMRLWQKPNRPHALISQPYNSGIVNIFEVVDAAKVGYQPVEELRPKISLHYDERKLGVTRHYAAMQNQIKVERVIRVQAAAVITNQDVAITEDGRKYRIDQVQDVLSVYPRSLDLALVAYEQEADDDMV